MTQQQQTLAKLMPQNVEAEQGLLGSLIIDPAAITAVLEFLLPEDFYHDAHRTIYRAMLTLYRSSTPADYITLCDALERSGQLDNVGGSSAITALVNGVPTSANAAYYGRIVEREAIRRRLIEAAGNVAALGYSEEISVEEAVEQAEQAVYQVAQRRTSSRAQDHRAGLSCYIDQLVRLKENRGSGVTGVASGLHQLDAMTGGFQKCDLSILCARPAIGKTSLAINIARRAITAGLSVLFFSCEMSREQVWQRLLSDATGIDQARLRSGWIHGHEWNGIMERYTALLDVEGLLTVDDTSGMTPLQMRSVTRRHMSERTEGVDLVLVDYIQLMKPSEKQERRDLDIGSITKDLKAMAKDLDVPILALAQLNRDAEGVEPQLSHLKDSGSIEEDSDLIMGLWTEASQIELQKKHKAYGVELVIMKHRNGPVGGVSLTFTPWLTRFEETVAWASEEEVR